MSSARVHQTRTARSPTSRRSRWGLGRRGSARCHASARTDPLGARAGARELHDVPRPARLVGRSHAWNVRMPMLCQRCHVATKHPSSVLRQRRHRDEEEQPDVWTILHELPSEHPRVNHPSGQFLHAVGQLGRTYATTVSRTCVRSLILGDLESLRTHSSGERRHRIHVRRWIGPVVRKRRPRRPRLRSRRADRSESPSRPHRPLRIRSRQLRR